MRRKKTHTEVEIKSATILEGSGARAESAIRKGGREMAVKRNHCDEKESTQPSVRPFVSIKTYDV